MTVRRVDADLILARVRGDSAREYGVGWDPLSGWFCNCTAGASSHRPCTHVRALQLITLEPAPSGRDAKLHPEPEQAIA